MNWELVLVGIILIAVVPGPLIFWMWLEKREWMASLLRGDELAMKYPMRNRWRRRPYRRHEPWAD